MSDLEPITFDSAQTALLQQLAEYWRRIAKTTQCDAAHCARQEDKHLLQRKAIHLLNCADELKSVMETGNLPVHLGFQIQKVGHRGLT